MSTNWIQSKAGGYVPITQVYAFRRPKAPPGLRPNAFILNSTMILPSANPNAIQNKSTSQNQML